MYTICWMQIWRYVTLKQCCFLCSFSGCMSLCYFVGNSGRTVLIMNCWKHSPDRTVNSSVFTWGHSETLFRGCGARGRWCKVRGEWCSWVKWREQGTPLLSLSILFLLSSQWTDLLLISWLDSSSRAPSPRLRAHGWASTNEQKKEKPKTRDAWCCSNTLLGHNIQWSHL